MPFFSSPFDFKAFTEDLSPEYSDTFNNDPGQFANLLFRRQGFTPTAEQQNYMGKMGNTIMGSLAPILAAKGMNMGGIQGANEFGNLLESYLRPNQTPNESFTDTVLNSIRSMAGKGNAGNVAQTSYLGNSDQVLGDVQLALSQRLGSYLMNRLFGQSGLQNLQTRYTQQKDTGGDKAMDIIQFLKAQGII